MSSMNKSQAKAIIENDYGLSENDLRSTIEAVDEMEAFATMKELLKSPKIDYSKLSTAIQRMEPKNSSQHENLLKICAVYFLCANGLFHTRRKNDALAHVLTFAFEDYPKAATNLTSALKRNRNILYFSRKISQINQNGRLLGLMLVWILTYQLIGEKMEKISFKNLGDLIDILDNVDIDLLPDNVNLLHILLECIGFLLNSIVIAPIQTTEYATAFDYTIQDIQYLKDWISKIYERFPVSHKQEAAVDANSRICQFIDYILKEYINTAIKDNSLPLLGLDNVSFSKSIE